MANPANFSSYTYANSDIYVRDLLIKEEQCLLEEEEKIYRELDDNIKWYSTNGDLDMHKQKCDLLFARDEEIINKIHALRSRIFELNRTLNSQNLTTSQHNDTYDQLLNEKKRLLNEEDGLADILSFFANQTKMGNFDFGDFKPTQDHLLDRCKSIRQCQYSIESRLRESLPASSTMSSSISNSRVTQIPSIPTSSNSSFTINTRTQQIPQTSSTITKPQVPLIPLVLNTRNTPTNNSSIPQTAPIPVLPLNINSEKQPTTTTLNADIKALIEAEVAAKIESALNSRIQSTSTTAQSRITQQETHEWQVEEHMDESFMYDDEYEY